MTCSAKAQTGLSFFARKSLQKCSVKTGYLMTTADVVAQQKQRDGTLGNINGNIYYNFTLDDDVLVRLDSRFTTYPNTTDVLV